MRPPVFQLQNLTFSVPGRVLLHDISLEFKPDKVYGLIGHNGSGKSTLLKLLTRQNQPTSGNLLLDNQNIAAYSAHNYAKHVAYLPQHLPRCHRTDRRRTHQYGALCLERPARAQQQGGQTSGCRSFRTHAHGKIRRPDCRHLVRRRTLAHLACNVLGAAKPLSTA